MNAKNVQCHTENSYEPPMPKREIGYCFLGRKRVAILLVTIHLPPVYCGNFWIEKRSRNFRYRMPVFLLSICSWMPIQIGLAKSFTGTLYTLYNNKMIYSRSLPPLTFAYVRQQLNQMRICMELRAADTKAFSEIAHFPFWCIPNSKHKIRNHNL